VPAVQYLGTKGYFTTYDAQPDAPLDPNAAAAWSRLARRDVRPGTSRAAAAMEIFAYPTPQPVIPSNQKEEQHDRIT